MSSPSAKPPKLYRKLAFAALNLWLVFHIAAIIVAPASVAPASPLVQTTWLGFQPYLQVLYLNHGYHYFAPEPSQSTLLGYTVDRAEGPPVVGMIPNREIEPRLLYHRHFMLTEFLPHAGRISEEMGRTWHRSYAEHLCKKYDGSQVTLARVGHMLPNMQMVRDGVKLDDPKSFVEQSLGTFKCDEF